jgi:putative peptidoglycan lipid II flippase
MSRKTAYRGKHFKLPDDQSTSVGRSTAIMSIATMLSRITGFGRTWAMAFALGSTALTSTYLIANNIPNQLYELVAGGVLTTAFLPIYLAQLKRKGRDQAANYSSNILSLAAITLGLVAILAKFFAPQVIWVQTFLDSGFDVERATFFFRFFSIQMVFYGIGAIINGLLNAHRSFLWPALGPVFNNIVVIITFIGYPFISAINTEAALIWLSVGTTLGVVVMFAVQLPALIKLRIPLRPHINLKDPALRDTFKLAGPAVLFVIMGVLTVMAMNNFATATVSDGPSLIAYAFLWYMLPYGVIAVALSTARLTEMSEASATHDWDKFRQNVRMGLRTILFLIIPLAAIIFCLSDQFAGLFRFGAFTDNAVVDVGAILMVWSLALPFYAAYMFIYRVFSAMRNLNRFVVFDGLGRVLQIALYAVFTMGFAFIPSFGLIGIPLADICINILLCSVMLYQLRKKIGTFGLTQIVFDGVKLLVAAIVAIAPPFVLLLFYTPSGPVTSFAMIAGFGILSLVIYYLMCRLLRISEVSIIQRLFAKVSGVFRRKSA